MADLKKIAEMVDNAVKDPDVPKLYANGFITGIGKGDISITLQRNAQPVAVLNLSFTVAKTLALKLGTVINDLEDKAQTEILTTEQFNKAFIEKPSETEEEDATN